MCDFLKAKLIQLFRSTPDDFAETLVGKLQTAGKPASNDSKRRLLDHRAERLFRSMHRLFGELERDDVSELARV